MAKVVISNKYCKGCMLCVQVCPKKALKNSGKLSDTGAEMVEFDEDAGCTGCTLCAIMCPDAAITVEVEEEPARSCS